MQIGCGIQMKPRRERDYVYFWHYESRDGRRKEVYDYVGPARDPESARKAVQALEGYTRKAIDEARRQLQAARTTALAAAAR